MKKRLHILLTIALYMIAISCSKEEFEFDYGDSVAFPSEVITYDLSGNELFRDQYTYDGLYRKTVYISHVTNGNTNKYLYIYDAKERIVHKVVYVQESENIWKIKYDEENVYDESGNLVNVIGWDDTNVSFRKELYRYIYTYDNDGHCLSSIYYDVVGGVETETRSTQSTYDEAGNIIRYESYSGSLVYKYEYSYSDDNNSTSLFYMKESESDDWKLVGKDESSYPQEGTTIVTTSEYVNGQWQYTIRTETRNDKNGRIIYFAEDKWDGTSWEKSGKREYTYDTYGNILSIYYYKAEKGEYILDSGHRYKYKA